MFAEFCEHQSIITCSTEKQDSSTSQLYIGQEVPNFLKAHLVFLPSWWRRCWGKALTLPFLILFLSIRSIADWLQPPDTWFLLDFIKPEFLLLRVSVTQAVRFCDMLLFPPFLNLVCLRLPFMPHYQTLARCIIMWDEILPNTEWVKSNIPQVRKYTETQHNWVFTCRLVTFVKLFCSKCCFHKLVIKPVVLKNINFFAPFFPF